MKTDTPNYRLGLDVGTNSIGWAAVRLDDNDAPCGLLDVGVRIFPDGREATVPGAVHLVPGDSPAGFKRTVAVMEFFAELG